MAKMKCPYCNEEVMVEDQTLMNILEDEAGMINCEGCGEDFEMPDDVREEVRTQRDYEDMAMLDFAADEEIDGDVD